MGNVFLIGKANNFECQNFFKPMQESLLNNIEGESSTSMKIKQKLFYKGLDQYDCHHDFKHNKKGRVFQRDFSYYFEPFDFLTYHNSNDGLTLVQIKTEIALDYVHQLNLSGYFNIEPVMMRFDKMIPYIHEIKGAWISELKGAHLKTAGYFGTNVNLSEEYKETAEEGKISSMVIQFISNKNGTEYTITLSNKGSIYISNKLDSIEDGLDLVLEVFNKLIKPHL